MRFAYTNLPYKCEVEYLQSSGTQYIDTGINADSNMGFETRFMWVNNNTIQGWGAIKNTGGSNWIRHHSYITGESVTNYYLNISTYAMTTDTDWHTLMYYPTQRRLNYGATTYSNTANNFDTGLNYWIFGRNSNLEGSKVYGYLRYSYFKIYQGTTLVRDFIPVIDWDGVACMYDKVTGQLFYNQGTGQFTAGREIHPVEYIESTGTQYINTGIKVSNTLSVELDYQLTNAVQSRTGLFGGLNVSGASSTWGRIGSVLSPSNNYLEHGYGNTNTFWQQGLPDTKRHTIYQQQNKIYFDETLVHTFDSVTFSTSKSALLGNFDYTNYTPALAKYYSAKMWSGDSLVRDFIPAVDENGVGFMFDRVEHSCHINAGTGNFLYGNEIKQKQLRLVYDRKKLPYKYDIEYIESTGTQYIDTGVLWRTELKTNYTGSITSNTTYPLQPFFGARDLNSAGAGYALGYNSDSNFVSDNSGTRLTSSMSYTLGSLYNIVKTQNNITITGNGQTETITGAPSATQQGTHSIYLFGMNNNGNVIITPTRVNSFQILYNNTLVRDFIPVIDWDGVACMYDKVTGQLFYNQGTGQFIAGREIHPVEYIESTGTQYIDTGVDYNDNTSIKCTFAFVEQTITAAKHLIGGQMGNSPVTSRYNPLYCTVVSNENKIRTLLDISGSQNITRNFDTNIHTIEFNTYPDKKVIYDGVVEGTVTSIGNGNSINVFRRNFPTGYAYCNGRIYCLKIGQSGVLVRDFIPAVDENGVAFMFDNVTHSAFLNAGTGNFVAGNEITPRQLRLLGD